MTTRRLAAILAADVVGFSSMMEKDEEGTAARIRALRGEVIEPALARHHGRLVKSTGDGFLVEFASPVEAVRSAIAIQDALDGRENGVRLRVGVNLGDIIIEDDGDVLGEGVNVAARLEQMADPGGVLVSGKIYEEVEGKIGRHFEWRGEQQVKNIVRPLRVYALTGTARSANEPKPLPLPDKPSIAVLPFTNMSGPEEDYFCDGLVEDIITALSRVKWFFVIARNSSFTYKGRAVDVRQVGKELGVRYVLEGSVQKAGNRLRITGQLINADTAHHVWAERFDGTVADVFELQDRITETVVGAIEPSVQRAEIGRAKAKPTSNLTAYDMYLQALPHYHAMTEASLREGVSLLERAILLDPSYTLAKAFASFCYGGLVNQGWYDPAIAARAVELAKEALADDRDDPTTLRLAGHTLGFSGKQHDAAIAALDRSLRLNPNAAPALSSSGWVRIYAGDAQTAIQHFQKAMRLSPLDMGMYQMASGLSFALTMVRRYDEALEWARKALEEKPSWASGYRCLILALMELGRCAEAEVIAREFVALFPSFRLAAWASTQPFKAGEFLDRYLAALRLAGLPE